MKSSFFTNSTAFRGSWSRNMSLTVDFGIVTEDAPRSTIGHFFSPVMSQVTVPEVFAN